MNTADYNKCEKFLNRAAKVATSDIWDEFATEIQDQFEDVHDHKSEGTLRALAALAGAAAEYVAWIER